MEQICLKQVSSRHDRTLCTRFLTMGFTHLITPFLFALPLVVGATSLTANPPSKRNGLSAYANALRKWGTAHADGASASASGIAKRLSGEPCPPSTPSIRNLGLSEIPPRKREVNRPTEELETQSHENDTFYTVDIGVGSPGQTLPVILDTGSSDT